MAEPIVLIPGLMADARAFQHQITAFSAQRPVMVAAPTLGERIEEMASALLSGMPQRCALVGVGLGGVIAVEILRRAPERVNRIALLSVDLQADTPAQAADRELTIARVRAGRLADVMSDLVPLEHMAPVPHRLEVQKLMVEMGTSLGPDLFIRQSRALQRRRDYQSNLSRIKIPATVMTGADDPVISPKRLKFMTDMIPRGHLHLIENAGHLPHLEQPAATLAALQTWLKQPLVLG